MASDSFSPKTRKVPNLPGLFLPHKLKKGSDWMTSPFPPALKFLEASSRSKTLRLNNSFSSRPQASRTLRRSVSVPLPQLGIEKGGKGCI